jgi:hypothetical protein
VRVDLRDAVEAHRGLARERLDGGDPEDTGGIPQALRGDDDEGLVGTWSWRSGDFEQATSTTPLPRRARGERLELRWGRGVRIGLVP